MPYYLPHWSGEEGELRRAAISMAINRDEITDVIFQGTRTPATDFTSPVIDGWSDETSKAPRSSSSTPKRRKALWAEADAIAPVTATRLRHRLQRRRRPPGLGRRRREQHHEHPRHRGCRQAVPDVRRGARRPREREADRCHPRRMAGRLPVDVQLPRRRCTGTGAGSNDEGYSSQEFDDAARRGRCRRRQSKRRPPTYQQAAGDPLQGPPRHPAVVLERRPALRPTRSTTWCSAGTRSRCTTQITKG